MPVNAAERSERPDSGGSATLTQMPTDHQPVLAPELVKFFGM